MSSPKARQGFINLAIRDKDALHAAYMPYLKNGGIFIRTDKTFELGDEVFLLLTLIDDPERHPVTGKVVWITPRISLGGRPMGIGIQFGADSDSVQQKILTYLAGYKNADRPTSTM